MKLLENYWDAINAICDHVGFGDYNDPFLPIDDCTNYYWALRDGKVGYSEDDFPEDFSCAYVYETPEKNSFFDKSVWEGEKYTMVYAVRFMILFDNSKRRD